METNEQQLIALLKGAQQYTEEVRNCGKCRHSKPGGFDGYQLHCALNKAKHFEVSERGTCYFFEPAVQPEPQHQGRCTAMPPNISHSNLPQKP